MIIMKNKAGFTLIEVLIAMLILAVGLLGLAGMQMNGLRNNLSAYHRSQATQLAYDIADRMRANVDDAGNFGGSTYITLDPADAVIQASCTAVAGDCSSAQMAQQDLFEWYRDLTATLPGATEDITVAGSLFTVTLSWDDDRDGDVDANDPNFTMSFQL